MSFFLKAIIGKSDDLKNIFSKFDRLVVKEMPQSISIIPVVNHFYETITNSRLIDEYTDTFITDLFLEQLSQLSKEATFGYIEAEYFGGTGTQKAVLFIKESKEITRFSDDNAINSLLQYFDVQKKNGHDEFDTIGLGQIRDSNKID